MMTLFAILLGPLCRLQQAANMKTNKRYWLQMYVTSIMFGYFVRRVDSRFQLERSAGIFNDANAKEEAVNKLERLFSQADSMELTDDPDSPSASSSGV